MCLYAWKKTFYIYCSSFLGFITNFHILHQCPWPGLVRGVWCFYLLLGNVHVCHVACPVGGNLSLSKALLLKLLYYGGLLCVFPSLIVFTHCLCSLFAAHSSMLSLSISFLCLFLGYPHLKNFMIDNIPICFFFYIHVYICYSSSPPGLCHSVLPILI